MRTIASVALSLLICGSGFAQTVRWEKGAPGTDVLVRDGAEQEIITLNGITVTVSTVEQAWDYLNKNYFVRVSVKNASENRILVDPANVGLFNLGDKGKAVKRAEITSLVQMHGRAPSAILSNYFGQNQAAEAAKAQNVADFLIGTALKANTVLPGEEQTGLVWFNRSGKQLLVQVRINDTVFEFPFAFK